MGRNDWENARTDLRKGKYIPFLFFCVRLRIPNGTLGQSYPGGKCDELAAAEDGGGNGALSESITTADDLIRSAQPE